MPSEHDAPSPAELAKRIANLERIHEPAQQLAMATSTLLAAISGCRLLLDERALVALDGLDAALGGYIRAHNDATKAVTHGA